MALFRRVVVATLLFCGAAQAAPPQHVKLEFDLKRGSDVVKLHDELQHDGATYLLRSEAKGSGLKRMLTLKLSSRGTISASGLQPTDYLDERSLRAAVGARFDWSKKKLNLRKGDAGRQENLLQGTQDRLSMLYHFAFKPAPLQGELLVRTTDGKGQSQDRFRVLGDERVVTQGGTFTALHLSRVRESDTDRAKDLWLAKDKFLLPIRVLIVEPDGERIEQVLTRLSD
jgi:hypothetical protein